MTNDIKIILVVLVVTFILMLLANNDCWGNCRDLWSWFSISR